MDWAKDGRRLAFVQQDQVLPDDDGNPQVQASLWVWDLPSGCASKLVDLSVRGDVYWLWESDLLLVQVSNTEWRYVDPVTAQTEPAVDFSPASRSRTAGSALSLDEEQLLIWVREDGVPWAGNLNGAFLATLSTGEVRKVTDLPLRGVSRSLEYALTFGFIEGGSLYTDHGGPGNLINARTSQVLATDPARPAGMSPDGAVIVWPSSTPGVMSYRSTFGQQLIEFAAYPVVWLDESNLLARTADTPATLYHIDLAAGTARPLLSAHGFDCGLSGPGGVIIHPGDRGGMPAVCQMPHAGFLLGDNNPYGATEVATLQ
jgi:hypothetical protein